MPRQYRLPEEEVADYLAQAQGTRQAQDASPQRRQQEIALEQQDQQRRLAQKQEESQYRESEKAAKQEDARRVRAWKSLGAQTETSVETGKTTVATHDDGTVKSSAGPIGAPVQTATMRDRSAALNVMIGGGADAGAQSATGGQSKAVVEQKIRNDRWQESYVEPRSQTDKRGIQYVPGNDPQTGQPTKQAVGIDDAKYDAESRLAGIKQRELEIDEKKNRLKQAQARMLPRWEPIENDFQKTSAELEKINKQFVRDAADKGYLKINASTGQPEPLPPTDDEISAWEARKLEVETRLYPLKQEREKLRPTIEYLKRTEAEAAEEKLLIEEERIQLERGLPPKDRVSEVFDGLKEGEGATYEEVARARLKDLGVGNPTDEQVRQMASSERAANYEASGTNPFMETLAAMDLEEARTRRDESTGAITPEDAAKNYEDLTVAKTQVLQQAREEAKQQLEAQGREIASQFIGTGVKSQRVAGAKPGVYAELKNEINELGAWITGNEDTPENTAQLISLAGQDLDRAIGMAEGKTKQSLTAMKAAFDKAGIKPEDRARIIKDAAMTQAWTEKDSDNLRKLSTGDIVINPGKVFGQKDALIAEIKAADTTPQAKASALKRLDAMREAMAIPIFKNAVYADRGFNKFANQQYASGNKDKAGILDQWTTQQQGRNPIWKATDAITEGIKTGSVGVTKTIVGSAAGLSALVGLDGAAASIGQAAEDIGGVIQFENESAKLRGMTGGYAITSELTNTVAQMAPMLVGGVVAGGLKGASQIATRGASVYGWAFTQGYESKLSDAVSMAAEQKGSALTSDEIAGVLGQADTQIAGFLNAAQTAILAAAFPKGAESGALGKVSASMTVSDFIRRGGMRAVKDGTLRQEIKTIGKNIFADAKDEALEEFSNQVLDGMISVAVLDKELKLGTLLEESFKAGAMGAVVGGAMPQVYAGQTKQQQHERIVAALQNQTLRQPDISLVSTALASIDPQAKSPTETEIKQARQLVLPSTEAIKELEQARADYAVAINAKDYKGAAAIDQKINERFTQTQSEAAIDAADAVLLTRELSGLELEASKATFDADEALTAAKASGDRQAIAQAQANLDQVLKTVPNAPLVRAAVKLGTGRGMESLTDKELRAVGYKPGQSGTFEPMTAPELKTAGISKPLVRTGADGSAVLLDEAIQTVVQTSGMAANRIKLGEQEAMQAAQARFDAQQQSPATTGVPTDSLPEGQQGVAPGGTAPPPLPRNAPPTPSNEPNTQRQARGIDATAEAALYEAARTSNPALPEIPQAVTSAFGESRPVSTSMQRVSGVDVPDGYTRQGNMWTPPAVEVNETPSPAPQVPSSADARQTTRAKAEAAIERIAASRPKIAGMIRIDGGPATDETAGASALPGEITINLADLEKELSGYDAEKQAERIDAILDEEIIHLAQYEAVKRMGGDVKQFYAELWNEFTPEQKAAAAKTYQSSFAARPEWQQAAETVRILIQQRANGQVTELTKAFSKNMSARMLEMLREAVAFLKDVVAGGNLSQRIQDTIKGIETILAEYVDNSSDTKTPETPNNQADTRKNSDISTDKESFTVESEGDGSRIVMGGEVLWRGRNDQAATALEKLKAAEYSSLRLTGLAISAATDRHKLNEEAKRELNFALDDLADVVDGLPANERTAFLDQAIDEWVEELRTNQKSEDESKQGKSNVERAARVKQLRKEAKTRLRDKARTILNSDVYAALSSIFAKGKITPKPNVIPLILARKKQGKKLTEKELSTLRNSSDFDGAPTKANYAGGGNNVVIREILDMLYARQGEGMMPNVMADGLVDNVKTASEMFEMVAAELRALSKGKTISDSLDDPEHEWTDAEIAAYQAKQEDLPDPINEDQVTLQGAYDYAAETFGAEAVISQKIKAFSDFADRIEPNMMLHVRAALSSEFQRHADGLSIVEHSHKLSGAAGKTLNFIQGHTPDTLRAALAKLPVVQTESDPLFSSPAPRSPFYSQLSRTLEEKMPKTAPVAQVVQIATSGAKVEEIKWSGLVPWLQSNSDGKVSKDAVLRYLADEGSVRFEEVTIGKSNRNELESQWADAADEAFAASRNDEISNDELEAIEARRDSRSVRIEPKEGESFKMMVDRNGIVDGHQTADQFNGKRLDEVVGKDMADKIMGLESPADFEGDGLKVGGSGMKGFYDNMFPKEIGKYVKQWGAKVEKGGVIITPEKSMKALYFDTKKEAANWAESNLGDHSYEVMEGEGGRFQIYDEYTNRTILEPENTPIWRIDITPAMRAGVSSGQALFSSPTPSFDFGAPLDASTKDQKGFNFVDSQATDAGPHKEGFEVQPKSIVDGFMSPDFKYRIGHDFKVPEGSKVIASEFAEYKEGKYKHGRYRLVLLEDENGDRYVVVEKGSGYGGNSNGETLRFEKIASHDLDRNQLLSARASKLWDTYPAGQQTASLFDTLPPGPNAKFIENSQKAYDNATTDKARENIADASAKKEGVTRGKVQKMPQGMLDFGASGGFNTRNQLGFDFAAKPTPQPEAPRIPEITAVPAKAVQNDAPPEPGTPDFRLLPNEDKKEIVVAKTKEKSAEKSGITDFGEKLGGARKDLATKTGESARPKKTNDKPGWFNRYVVNEVVAEVQPSSPLESYISLASGIPTGETGRFIINDKRKTDWRGNPERATRKSFATREEAEAYIPIIEVSRNHRVRKGEDMSFGIWRTVTDRKMVQVVKQSFETREEAESFMTKNAADIIETKTAWREELIAKPENAVRIGAERRTGPATPEMFQEAFAFRGVEFGNWMRQTGDGKERQEVLNHAYDGLLDLAELLSIPPKAISLNGELGLAFGARGQGLSGAKAHYEPDYVVINLTKMSGAGSLAHEWIHAFDHYLGRQDGRASAQLVKNKTGDMILQPGAFENNAVSSGFSRQSKVREDVRNAFVRLMDTIMTKAVEYVEDSNNAEKFVAASRKALEEHLAKMRKDYTREPDARWEKRRKKATEAQLTVFDSIADRLINGQDLHTEWREIASNARLGASYRWTNDTLEQLGVIHKEITNRAGFDKERNGTLNDLQNYMNRYEQRIKMLESAAASETKVKKVPTDFSMNAKRIDQGSASDYWNVPHEMLARGFSAYVEDRIAATGGTSDFLSYGSDNRLPKYRMLNVKPFPEGTEREAINEKFDALFDVIVAEETDSGVRLYASPTNQRSFDFGTTGGFNTKNQEGFDFSDNSGKEKKQPLRARSAAQSLWDWASDASASIDPREPQGNLFDTTPNPNQTQSNDIPSSTNLESDRSQPRAGDGSRSGGVSAQPGATGQAGRSLDDSRVSSGNTSDSGAMPTSVPATTDGIAGDSDVSSAESPTEGSPSRNPESGGRSRIDDGGLSPEQPRPNEPRTNLVLTPESTGTLAPSGSRSTAERVTTGQWKSPLTPEQKGDVDFIEDRLIDSGKPGVLLTNGTGTGKTFSGLGAIKQALDRGAKHILVVAPSDKVGSDWKSTAREFFDIQDAEQLIDTKDNGGTNRLVMATYANLGQNDSLINRPWDLIVADEAHYLSQNKEGKNTNALDTFRALTWHKDGIFRRAEMLNPRAVATIEELRSIARDSWSDAQKDAFRVANNALDATRAKLRSMMPEESERPKAILLSATPFAWHFSLDYAEGYLFDHGPEPENRGYNTPSARDRFYVENFGYRMRTGKLTQPDAAANTAVGILERRFAEKLMKERAMSGRALKVDQDYSRQFILSETKLGEQIDTIIKAIRENPRFAPLSDYIGLGDYLARRYLLEGMKARESVARIRQHLAIGRKVVVFHDYKKGGATNPLEAVFHKGNVIEKYNSETKRMEQINLPERLSELKREIPEYEATKRELNGLLSPIDRFEREFPQARIFNGSVPKGQRRAIIDEFNRSGGPVNLILVQRASGKEGISLHDRDGKHQRVFIDIGLANRPTDAIQGEGRIYRHGVQSNAIIEYLSTGTDFERQTFAETIAKRSSTAENLAMGERARSLLQSFANGYNNAEAIDPNDNQGTGGKEMDRQIEAGSSYKTAVALFYTNQKKTSRNKSSEGIDYFATPEPLGFKMVEWADIQPGEKVLEPSAGHGSIARFFPDSTNRHAIEPSSELASRLALNATDITIHRQRFEDFNTINKFNAVVMNPPFGTAGKTAMDHVIKALGHLRNGGRAVALIPEGSSMQKRFDKWYESNEAKNYYVRAEINLPTSTFERAGTGVSTRVVIIDKLVSRKGDDRQNLESTRRDLTRFETLQEFIDELEFITVPPRPEVAPVAAEEVESEQEAEAAPTLITGGRDFILPSVPKPEKEATWSTAEFNHSKTGVPLFVAKIERRLSKDEYAQALSAVKRLGGYYSSYNKDGAIPGFHFKSAEARDAFIGGGASVSGISLASSPSPQQPDLFAAATAPDAPKNLGQVKVGNMSALAAYRTLTAKRDAGKALSAKEEQQLLNAETALGQKLAFDMDAVKDMEAVTSDRPAAIQGSLAPKKPQAAIDDGGELFGKERTHLQGKDGQMRLFSSPTTDSPESSAVQAALAAMPEIYRKVFEDIQVGDSPATVMARYKMSDKAVTNILNQVRARIATATAASADALKPTMQGGKIKSGRPDLALSTNLAIAAVDQLRNQNGVPDVRGWDEVNADAAAMLAADYQGVYDALLAKARAKEQMSDVEVAAAKKIISRETLAGKITTPAERTKLGLLIYGYREIGTETARSLAIRRDPHKSPAERHAQYVAEALFTPDPATRARMSKKPQAAEEILAGWMKRVDGIEADLLAQGIDIRAALAEFNRTQEAQKEAVAESPQTESVVAEQIRKLNRREKAVIEAIRGGSLVSNAAFVTGLSTDEVKAIYSRFVGDVRTAMSSAAKRFLDGSLAASPSGDMMGEILADLGLPSLEAIDDTAPGFVDKRGEKSRAPRKPRTPKANEGGNASPPPPPSEFTPEQEAALAEAFDRFRNAPPSTWTTFWQTEAQNLTPLVGQVGFEYFKGKASQAWTAQDVELFERERKPINEATGTWREERPYMGQGELIREEINEATGTFEKRHAHELFIGSQVDTDVVLKDKKADWKAKYTQLEDGTLLKRIVSKKGKVTWEVSGGTFDIHDPIAVKRVMDAFAISRGSKMDALMEFWKMSILTGPQTHIVNAGSNTINSAFNLLPRRASEAMVNHLLGLVGQGSEKAATFGEFAPMAKNLKKGVQLAARLALNSWKGEMRTFEAYASAASLQLDLSGGVGAEYIPPALGGKIGKVMRSLSFRAMTAADEFTKTLYAQMEAAAQAHRIAKVEEKLTGAAYEARLEELMEPGSVAWLRSIDAAKVVTFQQDIDGSNPQLIRRLDQLAELAKKGRSMPWIGRPLTFFMPFIDTPLNIFKQAVEYTPLGAFLAVVDGSRALKRRIFAGELTKEEARAEAALLYDRARLIRDMTNQTIALAVFFAVQGLVGGDDEDELPVITGTVPYKSTRRGERDNALAVMPPMTIRLGGLQFSYSRIEPFATVLASLVDLHVSMNRNGGFQPAVASEWLMRFKDQIQEKTFLQGLASLLNAVEDPDRFTERLTANIATGFVPNLIRQPIREMDRKVRDQNPRADDGFLTAVSKRVGYSLVPQLAPMRMTVWGEPIPVNRGDLIGGNLASDMAFRIFDPTNAQLNPQADTIDRWIHRYNLQTADSKHRVAIEPIENSIMGKLPGQARPQKIPITEQEQEEANRNAGRAARAALGDGWEKRALDESGAELIKRIVSQAQARERERLRNIKINQAMKKG